MRPRTTPVLQASQVGVQKVIMVCRRITKRISVFFIIVISCVGCLGFQKEILIPKAKIQEMIDKKFPFDQNMILARIKLHSPIIYFSNKKVGIKLAYNCHFLINEIRGQINLTGEIVYKSEYGTFYLSNFDVVNIEFNKSSFSGNEKLVALLTDIVNVNLKEYPIYKLDPDDFKQNFARRLIKEIRVKGDNFVVVLSK